MEAKIYALLTEPTLAPVSDSGVEDESGDTTGPPHSRSPNVDVTRLIGG